LNATARYRVESDAFNGTVSGNTLMNGGLNIQWTLADYQSMLIWLYKV
jgi:alpha-galactosidase